MTPPKGRGRNGNKPNRPSTPAARPKISTAKDTLALSHAISQLFALKGYANAKGDAQLSAAWKELAGERIATRTAVLGVNRGVLQVGVSSAALLGELASFHKPRLVADLKSKFPALKLRDIKFRLRGDLNQPAERPADRANGRGREANESGE
jgi:hypothetical protein